MLNGESACALRDSGEWRVAGKDPESVIKKEKVEKSKFFKKDY
jgi:hypothetical protein